MDFQTIAFLSILILLATCVISLAVAKKDRKKVFLVVGGFVGMIVAFLLIAWLLNVIIPDRVAWLRYLLGFIGYSLLLMIFGDRMASLADSPKTKEANQPPQPTAVNRRG